MLRRKTILKASLVAWAVVFGMSADARAKVVAWRDYPTTFNGTSTRVTLPAVSVGLEGSVFLEFKTNNTSNTQCLWYLADVAGGSLGEYRLLIGSNTLMAYQWTSGGYAVIFSTPFTDTTNWHSVSMTWKQGSQTQIVLDGVVVGNVTPSCSFVAFASGTSCHLLGAYPPSWPARYFSGQIRNMAVGSPLSRGNQLLLDKGIQIHACLYSLAHLGDTWTASYFNGACIPWGPPTSDTILPNLPAGTQWSRYANAVFPYDTTPTLSTTEQSFLQHFRAFSYGDELDGLHGVDIMTILPQVAAVYANWNSSSYYPDAISHTVSPGFASPWGADLPTYMAACNPDMICHDTYPDWDVFFTGTSPPGSAYWYNRQDWYRQLARYRTAALNGNDGSGAKPIPYASYLKLFRDGGYNYTGSSPQESYVYLQEFASWAFGYKFLLGLAYYTEGGITSALFDSAGGTTATYTQVAAANLLSLGYGNALKRLVSTGPMFMKVAKTGSSTYRLLPDGMTQWPTNGSAPTTVPSGNCLTSVKAVVNSGSTTESSTYNDIVIGYFLPLKADNRDYPFANGLHFMIVNGAAMGSCANSGQIYMLDFNFANTGYNGVQIINNSNGTIIPVGTSQMTSLGSNKWRYWTYVPGGCGNLYRCCYLP